MLLQNRDEHIGCRYYANGNTALFGRRCFVAGERLPAINRNKGVMMYVVSGSVEIEMSRFVSDPLGSRTLFFLPQNIPFYGRVVENLELCTCTAPPQIPLCGRYDLMDLQQDMANLNNGKIPPPPPLGRLPIVAVSERLASFYNSLLHDLDSGLNCIHYHELKRQELFILLRAYCSKQELYGLFFPIVGNNKNFRNFIFQNYKEVNDVSEFASLANMTVRSFQRRFKSEFSCSARDWLIARRAESILLELRTTEKDLTDIAFGNGFSTMSYFTTFCKQHLGMTPTEIRGQRGCPSGGTGILPVQTKELANISMEK